PAIKLPYAPRPYILIRLPAPSGLNLHQSRIRRAAGRGAGASGRTEETMGTANFGLVGLDWQQRVNWQRMREYRIERARQMMKKHGLGAMLCMYDENVRYITGTLTPGWNRLKPGLRYAML